MNKVNKSLIRGKKNKKVVHFCTLSDVTKCAWMTKTHTFIFDVDIWANSALPHWPVTVVELVIPVLLGYSHGQLPVRLGVAPHGPCPGRYAVCGVLAVFATPAPGHIVYTVTTGDTGHAPLGVHIYHQLMRGQRARARVSTWGLATLTRALTGWSCSLTFEFYYEKYAAAIDVPSVSNSKQQREKPTLNQPPLIQWLMVFKVVLIEILFPSYIVARLV